MQTVISLTNTPSSLTLLPGNLTKHMKSKAHSKKCLEIGVPVGLIDDQDAEDSGTFGTQPLPYWLRGWSGRVEWESERLLVQAPGSSWLRVEVSLSKTPHPDCSSPRAGCGLAPLTPSSLCV